MNDTQQPNLRVIGVMLGVLAIVLTSVAVESQESESRPNVVLILADDLGYGDLSCYGQTNYQTPAIDQLAKEGVRATDFYVPVPYCAPSRAALLTGRFPFRNGITRNPHPGIRDELGLRSEEVTLGEVFQQAGYATSCIGKWHLGHTKQFHPSRHGFDEYFGILYSNDMVPVQIWDNHKVVENPADQTLLTKKYTARAVNFIRQHKDSPFFLYLPHAMPHKPLAASDEYYTPDTSGDLYADVVRELDGSVGTIRRTLEKAGILERTIFIFMSDNGPHYGGSTGGLKGKKATAWEGGVRVPFIVRYPAEFPVGQVVSMPLWSLDIFPTLLGLVGIPLPDGVVYDGENISTILKGKQSAHPPIFTAHNESIITIRDGDWKLYVHEPRYLAKRDLNPDYVDDKWPNGVTILAQKEQPTSMQYPGVVPKRFENPLPLFNLAEDPAESTDLAAKHPEIVRRLQAKHQRFLKSMSVNKAQNPIGFAATPALGLNTTTGGAGGKTVIVASASELKALLAKRKQAQKRGTVPPLVIEIKGILSSDEAMIRVEDVSNLTITGGEDGATIKGFGLFIKRSSNIIIKNLTFVDCPDDAINCGWTKTHHVWIDHCTFTDNPPGGKGGGKNDGMVDISGGASYITVSWCHFKNHRKTCLLGHSDKNGKEDRGRLKTTYHHNWFDGTYSRHPRVRFGECHVFNNYYVGNNYGVASTMEADVVVEGNCFEKVESPTHVGYAKSAPGDLVERNNLFRHCENAPETRGDAFDPRKYYPYTVDDPKDVPSIVSANAGAPGKL